MFPGHVENVGRSPDHLYLVAKIQSAQSTTGFKVSILRGNLQFHLSRSATAKRIEVVMEGFKSVRITERGNVNMNSGYEVRDMSERLCLITWTLGEDVPLIGGHDYSFDFSALLDARLPRTIKAGSSRIYYRLSADIVNLRNLKTETRLNVPWSRSAVMAAEEQDVVYESAALEIEQGGSVVIQVPKSVIKGPERSMLVKIHTTKPVSELHLTHVDVEILQNVTVYLERLREPHTEPPTVAQSVRASFPEDCSVDRKLEIPIPLPAEIHADMRNPHLTCTHVLRVTCHRTGMFHRAKVHTQAIVLYHLDLDHWKGRELPMYDEIMTQKHNKPFYEYSSMDRKYADAHHNVL